MADAATADQEGVRSQGLARPAAIAIIGRADLVLALISRSRDLGSQIQRLEIGGVPG
jgi:hypothetical protein